MKILINTTRLVPLGGVANHYLGLRKHWSENVLYHPIGKKTSKPGTGIYHLPKNILTFVWNILFFSPDAIVLNPSMAVRALRRDVIFLRIALFLRKKVIVFFHGFNIDNVDAKLLEKLVLLLNRCSGIFVLATSFRFKLRELGVSVPILLTTTKIDDEMLQSFDISCRKGEVRNILFLSRIVREKGIFIALDALKILRRDFPYLKLTVAGDGPDLADAKQYCIVNKIEGVCFKGAMEGAELVNTYISSDLYLLPSYHEGMPTTVLEAMAFGLPVVTRPVGGLVDFFERGKMGDMIESLNPTDYAKAIAKFIGSPRDVSCISLYNHEYATTNFLASIVAKDLENKIYVMINPSEKKEL